MLENKCDSKIHYLAQVKGTWYHKRAAVPEESRPNGKCDVRMSGEGNLMDK